MERSELKPALPVTFIEGAPNITVLRVNEAQIMEWRDQSVLLNQVLYRLASALGFEPFDDGSFDLDPLEVLAMAEVVIKKCA